MIAKRLMMLLGLLVLVGAGIATGAHFGLVGANNPAKLLRVIDQVRALPYLRLSFVCVYTVAAASGIPATPLTMAGGVLFGPIEGMILNWASDMLAAALAFGLAAELSRSFGRRATVDQILPRTRGFLGLLRLRVIPVVPFSVLNYGSAIYGMSWRNFLGATAVGVVPSIVVYTLLAASVVDGVAGAGRRALITTAVCAVGVIGLSLLPRTVRIDSVSP